MRNLRTQGAKVAQPTQLPIRPQTNCSSALLRWCNQKLIKTTVWLPFSIQLLEALSQTCFLSILCIVGTLSSLILPERGHCGGKGCGTSALDVRNSRNLRSAELGHNLIVFCRPCWPSLSVAGHKLLLRYCQRELKHKLLSCSKSKCRKLMLEI